LAQKIKIWLATMFGEAAVMNSTVHSSGLSVRLMTLDWTDANFLLGGSEAVFWPTFVFNILAIFRKPYSFDLKGIKLT